MRGALVVAVSLMLGCTYVAMSVIERFVDSPAIGALGEHTSNAVFTRAAPPVLRF